MKIFLLNLKLKKIIWIKKQEIFDFFDSLNNDLTHKNSKDDECTPMKCVEQMIDYIPEEFWNKNNLKILDPCSGNGNFGAYCSFKTDLKNIWFNELNTIRYENCKKILNPTHINNEDFFNMTGDFNNTKFDLIMPILLILVEEIKIKVYQINLLKNQLIY